MKASNIFSFVLGTLIFGTISVVSAYALLSSDVSYTPEDQGWNVNNVQDAIDDLYKLSHNPELIWANSNPTNSFAPQTINLDLSKYRYVLIVVRSSTSDDYTKRAVTLIPIGSTDIGMGVAQDRSTRYATVTSTGVTFSDGKYGTTNNMNDRTVPYKIYGIKGELELDLD